MGILSGVNIAEALSNTIFGGQVHADARRVPMVFTSTRRLRLLDPGFQSISSFLSPTESSQKADSNLVQIFQNTSIEAQLNKSVTQSVYGSGLSGELAVIEMGVNPNSITWKQPKRITKRDTQEGSVFFHFTNSKGENNDILTMEFRGNTGNINLSSVITPPNEFLNVSSGNDTGAAKKLLVWHNLWALTREPMLLEDNTINEFLIMYSSPVIVEEIMLIGFFSSVLDWSDTAEKPFSRDYSMSFTVQQIVPPINELMATVSSVAFNPDETGDLAE
jgi:hypothetical protein